jgi:hypothetical protein
VDVLAGAQTSHRAFVALAVALGFVVILRSPPARACSCAGPGELELIAPATDSDVPTNTLLWFIDPDFSEGTYWPLRMYALDDPGREIEVPIIATIAMNNGTLVVAQPAEPLMPATRYARVHGVAGSGSFVFTTGAGPLDGPPPAPPRVVGRTRETKPGPDGCGGGGSCGEVDYERFTVAAEGAILVMLAGDESLFDGNAMSGLLDDADAVHSAAVDMYWGDTACRVGKRPGGAGPIRFGTYDVAGNFSGWTRVQEASGCQVGPIDAGPWALMLAFVGLTLATLRHRATRRIRPV